MNVIPVVILSVVLLMSIVSFFLMCRDKQCAKKGKRRIPEKTLFLAAALFGAIGGTAGMWIFHHKTKHWYFRLFFPLMAFVQAAAVGYLLYRLM